VSGAGAASSAVAPFLVLTFVLAGIVLVAVLASLGVALARSGPGDLAGPRGLRLVLVLGGAVPAAIVAVYFAASLAAVSALAAPTVSALHVDVIGHQWWWEFRYDGVATANELHIPVGERVELRLLSADVIHSFWVPDLQGKTDVLPGQANTMWLEATRAGRFDGVCAEFCGVQHAWMRLVVVAEPRSDFDRWRAAQATPRRASAGAQAEGERIFVTHVCAGCHTIRGTAATATVAPDLTHLASRSMLGAGVLPNKADTLRAWLADPSHYKPGVLMPNAGLSDAELDALVTYLGSLE
jgi:cytochrome c oxidase subunit 2